ncbi:putative bifunctional diguanylate cyclase/phosphodiesterase [Cellulomonas humilata]|uniref:Diguanylate cyclase (GGDEF)-like protein n=1 Tax=Cellulomonas humilata TaxID=144055 RepID=A0ABU0EIM7_9CELL|nr:EAL domain-containing protein [Cellulomonas humilata]MDQ0375134.1 diguanylate cyclase (GGDEF)-like protein [Cellulomonas humilata]
MLVLGCALVWVTWSVMSQQSVRDGIATAETVTNYATATVPTDSFVLPENLDQTQKDAVATATSGFGERLVELRLWALDGSLIYSSADHTETGFPDGDRLDLVTTGGEPSARVITDVRGSGTSSEGGTERHVLDVYVPVHAGDVVDPDPSREDSDVIGAAEVMLDHTAAGAALAEAVRTLALVVALGLLALWMVLFRTVWTASRRLQATALENARLALLDSLTGLPNRRMLAERMRRTILEAEETGSRVGLMLLDIDRFKDINDSLGHDRGDELLEQVAERLRGALRDDDVVARLGGDEFAILLPDVRSVANAERLARRVRGLFVPPFMLGELPLHVDTSVGVACLPDHATDPSSLMRTADVAMYAAKHHRTGVSVYSADEDDSSPARLVLLGDLHRALTPAPGAPRELRMHYQPKIELATGRTVGLEALMRWVHPTRGVLPPTTFIPLAEQSGLIHDVTRYALTECVTQLAAWRAEGRATPVAVNLSAHDVTTVAVVDLIESLLEEHTVPADLLEVEITETALVADPSRVVPVLERLGALGIRVAIDDFGIGNTSISQLRDLPVDELKIDRLFVADLGVDGREGSEVVVQAMVDLAHSFDLRVVAEGVEDEPTAVILRRLGVDQAQGFLYSQAVPADDLRLTPSVPRPRRDRAGTRGGVAVAGSRPATTRHTRPPRSPGTDDTNG